MFYDLKPVRENYGMTAEEFAVLLNISINCYNVFEYKKEIPCKYIYMLWKKLPDFPIPDDFFYYTSFSLNVNMRYHRLKQEDVARMFNTKQATISAYFLGNPIPMYELKDKFIENFVPLIIPCTCQPGGNMSELKELDCRGNFETNKRKRVYKKQRLDTGLTTKEHRKMREKEREAILKNISLANA